MIALSNEKKTNGSGPSSTTLTVIIIILAVALAAAVTLLAIFFIKGADGAADGLFGGLFSKNKKKKTDDPSSGAVSSGVVDIVSEELDEETKKLYATEVMKIGGMSIDYETYRYYYLNCKASYDQGDPSYWETEEGKGNLQALKDDVQQELNYEIAAMLLAGENGVEYTEEDQKALDENVSYMEMQYTSMYGVSFSKVLESYYMTLNSYGWLYKYETLVDGLFEKLSDPESGSVEYDEQKVAERAADFYYVKHILYDFTQHSEDEALRLAQDTANEMKAIENEQERLDKFEEKIISDSADYVAGENTYYIFTDGEMVTAFEEATKALAEGTISEPVKSEYGYHVIYRLPMDLELFKNEVYASECVQKIISDRAEALTVETTAFFDTITPTTAK